jgi:predicted nucleic acid-binding protein
MRQANFDEKSRLAVIGTLQILYTAAEEGMIDFPTVLADLRKTTFRVSARLVTLFLERDASRKGIESRRHG